MNKTLTIHLSSIKGPALKTPNTLTVSQRKILASKTTRYSREDEEPVGTVCRRVGCRSWVRCRSGYRADRH